MTSFVRETESLPCRKFNDEIYKQQQQQQQPTSIHWHARVYCVVLQHCGINTRVGFPARVSGLIGVARTFPKLFALSYVAPVYFGHSIIYFQARICGY